MKSLQKLEVWKVPENREGFLKLDLNENHWINDKLLNKIKNFNQDVISSYPEYSKIS